MDTIQVATSEHDGAHLRELAATYIVYTGTFDDVVRSVVLFT